MKKLIKVKIKDGVSYLFVVDNVVDIYENLYHVLDKEEVNNVYSIEILCDNIYNVINENKIKNKILKDLQTKIIKNYIDATKEEKKIVHDILTFIENEKYIK